MFLTRQLFLQLLQKPGNQFLVNTNFQSNVTHNDILQDKKLHGQGGAAVTS